MDKDRVYTLKRSKKSERAIRVLRRISFNEEIKCYFILTAAVYVIYRIFLANAFVYTGYGYINFLVGCIFLVMYGTSILYYMYLSSSWSKNEDLYKDMDKRYI